MVYCECNKNYMDISFIELKNFRKLQSCRIDFSNEETVFVGANNSGKTSAMDALILFLKEKNSFKTQDFTLSNWNTLNEIGSKWATEDKDEYYQKELEELLPQLDLWITVEDNEVHYVNHLIPTLDWEGGLLGIRLKLTANDIEKLYADFKEIYLNSKNISGGRKLDLWPSSLWDFLDNKLNTYFSIQSYILDPAKVSEEKESSPQALPENSSPLDLSNALQGLIRVDIINAQRGFTDSNDENSNNKNLTSQLRDYYEKHLDPSKDPSESDITALQALENAKSSLDERLKESFKTPLKELEGLNYPGFGNPKISLSAKVDAISGLEHNSAVRFELHKEGDDSPLSLPESYNGLGYQNLISMVFKLIRFRDAWMQIGKKKNEDEAPEPLHLVLIEEPEAHLHAQAQQVFVKKAYDILRENNDLKSDGNFSTQLAISTHSSHIAYEVDFKSLRYFKRNLGTAGNVATSSVVNLSSTFGKEDGTSKFVARYLKTTHCDLFFADAVILVEGSAERMMVPHFIKNKFESLSSKYLSILEIGGSHAHTLRPLIDDLGIITLIITDLDSANSEDESVQTKKGEGLKTGNSTLKKWHPKEENIDTLLDLEDIKKVTDDGLVRIAYQTEVHIAKNIFDKHKHTVYPYTFEDSLAFSNLKTFKGKRIGNKFARKIYDAFNSGKNLDKIAEELFGYLKKNGGAKAEFALDLLFYQDPENIDIPLYIEEGFQWLDKKIKTVTK
jgi:predicted ATP-dependent endonuclease of OLD family